LSDFFESASKLLRGNVEFGEEVRDHNADEKNEETNESGTILVTLFEGLPYRLWNIRDLARDKGLVVRRSWKFDPSVYPGYKHARTAGTIMKGGVEGEDRSETAWKGEDRKARTFEFGLTDEGSEMVVVSEISHGKRKREEESSDEDSDDGV
jgi:25S rRNA (uracil2634-N3)-methyltransferase